MLRKRTIYFFGCGSPRRRTSGVVTIRARPSGIVFLPIFSRGPHAENLDTGFRAPSLLSTSEISESSRFSMLLLSAAATILSISVPTSIGVSILTLSRFRSIRTICFFFVSIENEKKTTPILLYLDHVLLEAGESSQHHLQF